MTLVCPKESKKFYIGFDMDRVCHGPLYLPCPNFPPETSIPTREEGDGIYINFTPMSTDEMEAKSLQVNGIPESDYEGNVLVKIYCKQCGLEYKCLFEA